MRVGYGYGRSVREFDDAGVERVRIDREGTDRLERTDLLRDGLHEGDTVVLLAKGDLGSGGELLMIRAELERLGVAVEVVEKERKRARPGPKALFDPDPEADTRARLLWKDTKYSASHVLKEIARITGYAGTDKQLRNALNHRYGGRTK